MKALKDVWSETRVLYRDKKSGFLVASFFFVNKLIGKVYIHFAVFMFKRKWRVKRNGIRMYDFNGALMPDIGGYIYGISLKTVFEDTFLVSCHYGDKYDKKTAEYVDSMTKEGPYGYKDGTFDVTVKEGDVVIDAGAWAGDFGAYCASKGALAYCFEPVSEIYALLCETAKLNGGKIIPVKMALGDKEETGYMSYDDKLNMSSKVVLDGDSERKTEMTTLDAFVEENNLQRVDFIKSDIEGFERNLLMGGGKNAQAFRAEAGHLHLPLAG